MKALWRRLYNKAGAPPQKKNDPDPTGLTNERLSTDLQINERRLQSLCADSSDVVFRSFRIAGQKQALLVYIEGLSNIEMIDRQVLSPLMRSSALDWDTIAEEVLSVSQLKRIRHVADCVDCMLSGSAILLMDGESEGLALALAKWDKRAIAEPEAESVVRGPREGFTETMQVNISMIRRKIKTTKLKIVSLTTGRYTNTNLSITYVEGIVEPELVKEVLERIGKIEIDGVLESSYIEEMILDSPYSPFPQLLNTERPDVVAANLLEGRVAILVDGTPIVLVVPMTFFSIMQSHEDYYQNFIMSSAIRWLRYGAMFVALLLPSIYVAVLSFHHEMVPSSLFFSISRSREEIPFPAVVEALIMEISFEALREAGVKLPKQIGAAVSIVGALVIGQAAVSAGIVSAPMVMVVAMTGISSFMMPRYASGFALRLLRFPIMLLSGTLGLFGTMLAVLFIVIHLCRLRTFGVPYLSPIAPLQWEQMKDVAIRAPWRKMGTRPHLTGAFNQYRRDPDPKPDPGGSTE